jgi:serine/threonine protein kinase
MIHRVSVGIVDFDFIKLISKGAFGRVWLVKRKLTGDIYAMKIINFAEKVIIFNYLIIYIFHFFNYFF